ncbi:hypothetical protein D3C87_1073050 [compost metagenome]
MACTGICSVVKNDLVYDCNSKPVGGIVQTVKLINKCDIDASEWTITRTGTGATCANLITTTMTDPATANAITIQGIPGKRLLNFGFATSNTEFGWYYTHTLNLFSQGLSQSALCNLKAFSDGAEVIAIVEQNFKGIDSKDAFIVLGWDTGLKLGDMTFDSNENNGNSIIPLTSLDPDLEPNPPLTFLMTDYATTKAFFDTLS